MWCERLRSPGGPMFLMPGLVIACYVTETQLPEEHRFEMLRSQKHMERSGEC